MFLRRRLGHQPVGHTAGSGNHVRNPTRQEFQRLACPGPGASEQKVSPACDPTRRHDGVLFRLGLARVCAQQRGAVCASEAKREVPGLSLVPMVAQLSQTWVGTGGTIFCLFWKHPNQTGSRTQEHSVGCAASGLMPRGNLGADVRGLAEQLDPRHAADPRGPWPRNFRTPVPHCAAHCPRTRQTLRHTHTVRRCRLRGTAAAAAAADPPRHAQTEEQDAGRK